MSEERPDKRYVREMWVGIVELAGRDWVGPEALYLTLAGALGFDIKELISRGVIGLTEVGALNPADVRKVVAVEREFRAYASLRGLFPGLTVVPQDIESLAGGTYDTTKFPGKRDRDAIRARVVNLDYNGPLIVTNEEGGLSYPQLTFIRKVAQLHASPPPPIDWTLLLTLNGQISWHESVNGLVRDYLRENLESSTAFDDECSRYLDDKVHDSIIAQSEIDFTEMPRVQQQIVISVLVPKKIASLVYSDGWQTQTLANWRYGGTGSTANMCTWAIRFRWDKRSSYQPAQVYQESLTTIFESFSAISASGTPVEDLCLVVSGVWLTTRSTGVRRVNGLEQ
jgi:hypothetical protein